MNFKACCGLLAGSKDNEDYDYDDVEDPLPEPQTAAYVQRKQAQRSTHTANVYTAAGYSAKAVSRAELRAETSDKPVRSGSAKSSTTRTPNTHHQHHGVPTMEPLTRTGISSTSNPSTKNSSSSSSSNNKTLRPMRRPSRQTSSSSSSSSAGAFPHGAPEEQQQHQGRTYGDGVIATGTVEALRPAAKGAVGLGSSTSSRVGVVAGASRLPPGRAPKTTTMTSSGGTRGGSSSSAAATFDLARFEEKLGGGLIVTKINRQGRAKVRTLFYDSKEKMLWWNEPGGRQRSNASKSSLLSMSLRKEQPLPVASLVKVEMAEKLDEPFCFDADVDKSFQLVFPARTVDLVAKDAEEAALLARGFQELKLSVSP